MASDPQIELRVSRLENDRDSVYELISDIRSTQQEHSRRFDAVDQRLDRVDQRFDAVDQRLDRVDERFDAVDQRLDTVDERLGSLDQRLESIATTLTEVVRRLPDRS